MRETPTRSESALWRALRAGALGFEVRRQVPIGRYIVDFLVPEARVVVEVDGDWHERRQTADERRDRALRRAGYRVLRVEAEEVLRELPKVVARIGELVRR